MINSKAGMLSGATREIVMLDFKTPAPRGGVMFQMLLHVLGFSGMGSMLCRQNKNIPWNQTKGPAQTILR